MTRTVVALGGNTLLGRHGRGTIDDQIERIRETATGMVGLLRAGHDVVLTHGNGPQVGHLLLQQEAAPDTPQLPLDVLVAETQASIGYLLQQALDNELDGDRDFITVVTQVLVDANDPAFDRPRKPIGPFYTEAEAEERPFDTQRVGTGERPYRRVVASPEPVAIVEATEIAQLVDRGDLVICGGGGGVPVVRENGLRGVEAVVDKDKTAALLGQLVGAEQLVLLTDVDYAYLDFGEPGQTPIETTDPDTMRRHLDAGEFGAGSMRPKVEACVRFVESGGELAVIASPTSVEEAVEGRAGTRVTTRLH